MKINCLIVLVGLFFLPIDINAQFNIPISTEYLKVGQEIPDFYLENIQHFRENSLGKADLKGKWTIIDFFSRGCVACFESFPHTNKIYKQYQEDVDIILV